MAMSGSIWPSITATSSFPTSCSCHWRRLFSGVLNATGRFAAAAAAPVLLNIFACSALIFGALSGGEVIRWLITVIPVAGVAQLALVWVATERAGIRIRVGLPRLTPRCATWSRIAVPAALAMGVYAGQFGRRAIGGVQDRESRQLVVCR